MGTLDLVTNVLPPYWSSASFANDRFGNPVNALGLYSGWIQLPYTDWYVNGEFTITAWANLWSFAATSTRLFDCGTSKSSQDNVIVAFQYNNDRSPYFEIWNSGSLRNIHSTSVFPLNTWTFLAATLSNDGTGYMYINNIQVSNGRMQMPRNVIRTKCYIGHSNWQQDSGDTSAAIDDFMLFSSSLSAQSLQSVMNAQYN